MLLSSLLEWYAWLKKPSISRLSVKRSTYATSWLMRKMKYIAPRMSGGMLNNTIKTHLVLHIAEDVLDFGVPENFNSAYAESAHISIAKVTAKNTQRRPETFAFQAAVRYVENLAIAQAQEKVLSEKSASNIVSTQLPQNCQQGKTFIIRRGNGLLGISSCQWKHPKKRSDHAHLSSCNLDNHVVEMICLHVLPHLATPFVEGYTEFVCERGNRYRAHPKYLDNPWFDYALVKWSDHDLLVPCRIHTFINLSCNFLNPGSKIFFPESGQDNSITHPGLYAVVQSYSRLNPGISDECEGIFHKYSLDLAQDCLHPILYLVPVESILSPTVGIDDISSSDDFCGTVPSSLTSATFTLFMMTRQEEWGDRWERFIHRQYTKVVTGEDGGETDDENPDGVELKAIAAVARKKKRKKQIMNLKI